MIVCEFECTACRHKNLSVTESLVQKEQFLRRQLREWERLIEPIVSVAEDQRLGYRKKVCLACEFDGLQWCIGMRRRNQVLDICNCPVQHTIVNGSIRILKKVLPSYINFPLVWYMQSGAQITLVVKSRELPDINWIKGQVAHDLMAIGVEGIWIHLNPSTGNKVIGKGGWNLIAGVGRSLNEHGQYYGPVSFQQLIPSLNKIAMDCTVAFFQPDHDSFIVDLYSGTGSTLKSWLKSGALAVGVESCGEAVECATRNAANYVILRGTVEQRIPQLKAMVATQNELNKRILLYANPPRTGLGWRIAEWIGACMQPYKIAYLSCSPGTLSHDLSVLHYYGYHPVRIIPFDFFPNTHHIEVLALLTLAGNRPVINNIKCSQSAAMAD